jgi:photosystem II stability/assembly factor-like uncharacterized protein
MFKNYALYIIIVLLIFSSSIEAQWVKCNGFSNEDVRSLITLEDNIFAGTIDKGIYVSSDNGTSWIRTTLNNKIVWAFAAIGNTLYAGTGGVGVFQSTNKGTSWAQTSLNNVSILSLTTIGDNIFAGTDFNGIYRSTNKGTSWTQTSINNKTILAITTLGNNIYASVAHEGIYMSTNMGTSWIKTSFPGDAWSFAKIDNNLYAGGFYGGVFLSTNGGTSWSQITLDGTTVYSMAAFGDNVFAGTYQKGIYLSENKGVNWNEINEGLPTGATVKAIQVKDEFVYAGTEQGVWRRSMSEITGVDKFSSEVPSKYSLHQNYPNPFNPSTTIKYELKSPTFVNMSFTNVLGEIVFEAINEVKEAGIHEYNFNAVNLSSGIYFYQLVVGNYREIKKMVLLR